MRTIDDKDIIYHYCSLSTFQQIVKRKTLRLSDITKSNDSYERKYVLTLVEDIICELVVESFPKECSNEPQKNKLSDYVKKYLQQQVERYDEVATVSHAMCFSKDGDLLSQWRGYADDGQGVSIGFSRSALISYLCKGDYLKVSDIKYVNNDSKTFRRFVKSLISQVKNHRYYKDACIEAITNGVCTEVVTRLFLGTALTYKNPGFSEEKEVRLHTAIPTEDFYMLTSKRMDFFLEKLHETVLTQKVEYGFFAKSNALITYFEIDFSTQNDGKYLANEFIKSIVIGPKAKISINQLEHIMIENNLGGCVDRIRKSETSYQ